MYMSWSILIFLFRRNPVKQAWSVERAVRRSKVRARAERLVRQGPADGLRVDPRLGDVH